MEEIEKIAIPRSRKEVQSFIGKVNFLRRFIPNCVENMNIITDMLKKDNKIRWTKEARKFFADIKRALTKAHVLISPDFNKDFQIYSFALEHTVAGILLQKNDEGLEQPIAFYSKTLRDAPLRYNIMEKQAFALIKALKDFKVYIFHSHTVEFVPSIEVKDIPTQLDPKGNKAKWIAILLEYDLDIKHTKLIKGQ